MQAVTLLVSAVFYHGYSIDTIGTKMILATSIAGGGAAAQIHQIMSPGPSLSIPSAWPLSRPLRNPEGAEALRLFMADASHKRFKVQFVQHGVTNPACNCLPPTTSALQAITLFTGYMYPRALPFGYYKGRSLQDLWKHGHAPLSSSKPQIRPVPRPALRLR